MLQMKKLRPGITQPMAKLEFDLGLLTRELTFTDFTRVPPFLWCQLCAQSCLGPSANMSHNP